MTCREIACPEFSSSPQTSFPPPVLTFHALLTKVSLNCSTPHHHPSLLLVQISNILISSFIFLSSVEIPILCCLETSAEWFFSRNYGNNLLDLPELPICFFLLGLLFDPEDGGEMIFRNVGLFPSCMALQLTGPYLFKEIIVYWLLQRLSVWFTKDLQLLETFLALVASPPYCIFSVHGM